MDGARWSEGSESLRYHFFLSLPLVMDLLVQRLAGAVSPISCSSAWRRERGGREETEEIKEEGERREGRGRCGEGGKEKTNCSLHESVYLMNL